MIPCTIFRARTGSATACWVEGKTLVEIADHLMIHYRTSANIAAQIKNKLNISSTPALIKWAVEGHQTL